MPASPRTLPAARRFAAALAVFVVVAAGLPAQPPPGNPQPAPGPTLPPTPAPKPLPLGVRMPDGTFLLADLADPADPDAPAAGGERVLLTPDELKKMLDQIEQLKGELARRSPTAPSGCAVRGRVEKKGDTTVATLEVTYSFRTTAPNTAVALGGKKAFLVSAALDGDHLPVLETAEDGFAALIEKPGDHTLAAVFEAPVAGRGTKPEVGFEVGLPRAAITTLALDAVPDVKRFTLSTRAPDPAQPDKPGETRREVVTAKTLVRRTGQEGHPLGPVDVVEVAWEPAAATPPAAAVQSAEIDVACLVAEGYVETTATIRPRGPARVWRVAAPADAVLTIDRPTLPVAAGEAAADMGPMDAPILTRPDDPKNPVWKITLPPTAVPGEWVVTGVVRTARPKPTDPRHKGPFAVGPFAVLGVARQTGEVRVTAPPHTHLGFKHGPELRRAELAAPAENETAARFRFATGPTGNKPPAGPLVEIDARPLAGATEVLPSYQFTLTEGGWRVRAELRVVPFRRDVDAVVIDLPEGWQGPGVSPPELVEGVEQADPVGTRRVLTVRLAAEQTQAFDLVLTATLPVPGGATAAAISLPLFPGAAAGGTAVAVSVPDGLEVRGSVREWDGDHPAGWGQPLAPVPGPDGKVPKAVGAVAGRVERGAARVDLAWSPYRPPLTATVRAEVTLRAGQAVVEERVTLRTPDVFTRPVRFRGPAAAVGLRATPALTPKGAGEWELTPAAGTNEATVALAYAVPLPPRPAAGGPWAIPVGLVWPGGTTRTETTARVWSELGTDWRVTAPADVWRALPPEPAPDRETLPVLTLAGSGEGPALALTADTTAAGGTAVWADRGLVQVWVGDGGEATCRGRFLLSRWLTDRAGVLVPGAGAGVSPEVFLDGRPVVPLAVRPDVTGQVLEVALPDGDPGRPVVLEVRYRLAAGRGGRGFGFTPPLVLGASCGPVRCQFTVPPGDVPLLLGGGSPERRWVLQAGGVRPSSPSTKNLEHWFRNETGAGEHAGPSETVAIRPAAGGGTRVFSVPRTGLVLVCSAGVLVFGLLLLRVPARWVGAVVAVAGGAAAAVAVFYPQPAGQVVAASQPGVGLLAVVLAAQAGLRWYYRHRVTHLPGFSRGRPEPSVATPGPPSTAHPRRPAGPGSTGPYDDPAAAPFPAGSSAG